MKNKKVLINISNSNTIPVELDSIIFQAKNVLNPVNVASLCMWVSGTPEAPKCVSFSVSQTQIVNTSHSTRRRTSARGSLTAKHLSKPRVRDATLDRLTVQVVC